MPSPESSASSEITGLILAGGRGRRMQGEDKGLIPFQGKPLIDYALAALSPIVDNVIISANRNQARYAEYGHAVISDNTPDYPGPLAGILAGLAATDHTLLVCPCDTPFVTRECFQRLLSTLSDSTRCAVAHDGERLQPMFLALAPECRTDLTSFFASGERKLEKGVMQLNPEIVDCSDHPEWFSNANSPADLAAIAKANPL